MRLEQPNLPEIHTGFSDEFIKKVNEENERLNKSLQEMSEEREQRYKDGVERERRMIELLESIDKNTSVLSDMLKLLEENTQDQKAILEIINDFNSLATINEPVKAQSMYRKIMDKINTALSDVNTMTTLYSYGMVVYTTLHSMGKI